MFNGNSSGLRKTPRKTAKNQPECLATSTVIVQNGILSIDEDVVNVEHKPYRLTIQIDKIQSKPSINNKKIKQEIESKNQLNKSVNGTSNLSETLEDNILNDESNVCLVCKETFIETARLHEHLKEHFTCDLCDAQFLSIKSHLKHYELHKSNKKGYPFRCHICELCFQTEEEIRGHKHEAVETKVNSEEKLIQFCKSCNMIFGNERIFRKHLKIHCDNVTFSQSNQDAGTKSNSAVYIS